MCKKIVLFLITICCYAVAASGADSRFTLVIDAGHGGHDSGAKGAVAKEKDLTLRYALAFGKLVEQNCPDVRVIYTRKTDKFVELYRRAEIANKNKADLFISIHINSLPKGRIARGFQTYTLGTSKRTGKKNGVLENLEVAKRENAVIFLEKDYKQTYHGYDPNSPESNIMFEFIQDKNMENSVELAKYMQRYVCQATGRKDMGAQQDNLAVLRLSSMPGCLVEMGFISTRDEESFMNSKAAEGKYARGLFNAFMAYRRNHGGGVSIPYQPQTTKAEINIPTIVPKTEVKEPKKDKKEREKKKKEEKPKETVEVKEQPKVAEEPLPQVTDSVQQEAQPRESADGSQESGAPTVSEQPDTKVSDSPVTSVPEPVAPSAPVFKVQIFASSAVIKAGDTRFKGLKGTDYYQEGGLYKYTVGASEDYNEIYRLRREVAETFPNAFIIATKDGVRMDVNEAIREFKSRKVKK